MTLQLVQALTEEDNAEINEIYLQDWQWYNL